MLLVALTMLTGGDTTLDDVGARHDRTVVVQAAAETQQIARVIPADLDVVVRMPAAPEAVPEHAFEQKYAGWSRDSLHTRSAKLRERFYELVEREADLQFDGGRYQTFYEGADRRSAREADRIRAVRKIRMGWYQEAVLDPEECPELYRVRKEIAWLDDAMARDDRG